VLKLLYRLPDEEWLDIGTLMSRSGTDADESATSIGDVLIIRARPGFEDSLRLRSRRHGLPQWDDTPSLAALASSLPAAIGAPGFVS
jgi:hypothetical protein